MKCVETFPKIDQARERKALLHSRGIESHMVVDPLESMAPALSPFTGVGLMVEDSHYGDARAILQQLHKKA